MTDNTSTRPRTPYEPYARTQPVEDATLHNMRSEADACAVVGERLGAALWSALRRARKAGRSDLRVWRLSGESGLLLRDRASVWTVRR